MANKGKFFKSAFKNIKPLDFIIIALVLVAGVVFCFKSAKEASGGDLVQVQTSKGTYEYALNADGDFTVEGELGKTTIHIENRKVCILDSPCPNKTCVNQGWGTTLVCLPNKVMVTVIQKESDFDAVAQ